MTADVAAWLDHLRVARRLAEHTLASYGRDLAILERFAAGLERPIAPVAGEGVLGEPARDAQVIQPGGDVRRH